MLASRRTAENQQPTDFNPADQVILRRKQDEVDKVMNIRPEFGVTNGLPVKQASSNDLDLIKKAMIEESYDFFAQILEGIDKDFEEELIALQRGNPRSRSPVLSSIADPDWIWGPELVLDPEAENVYKGILYSLLHAISRTESINQEFDYLKRAFQFTDAKHAELLTDIRERTPPDVSLHLDVIQARNLKAMDANGLSDPYCSIWISSNEKKFKDTSMKPKTLDPVWNESLNFPVKDVHEDILQLEIRDYDPDETVREKMSQISEVKGIRGMGVLIGEFAVATKTSGKSAHQFLGLLNVPLKSIPLSGIQRWYPLEGREKTKFMELGEIQLNLFLSAKQWESQLTSEESLAQYERLLKIIVEHEFRTDDDWGGLLPDYLLSQFATHRGLRQNVMDVCCWSVYSTVLHKRTLNFTMMLSLIQKLRNAIDDKLLEDDQLNVFWTAADSFVEAALSTIRNLRKNSKLNTNPEQLSSLLECLRELNLMCSMRSGLSGLVNRIKEAISTGAADWYLLVRGRKRHPICDDDKLENTICIYHVLMNDLQTILSVHEPIFQRIWQVSVFALVYLHYDQKLENPTKIMVFRISQQLKLVKVSKEQILLSTLNDSFSEVNCNEEKVIAPRLYMGTALFELYLCLQQFHRLSKSLPQTERDDVKNSLFYTWFETAIYCWLDVAVNKVLIQMGKAVSMDTFDTVDSMVKHSSSAVDTVTFFHQIKIFWDRLAWPDIIGATKFVNKIVEDIKDLSLFYAKAIQLKLERIHSGSPSGFFVSPKLCSAINSILHVQQSVKSFAEEIGFFKLNGAARWNNIDGLPTLNPDHDSLTEIAVIDNNEIYISIARKFAIEVARLINRVMESDFAVGQTDELSSYICNQLVALDSHLSRNVFLHFLNIIYHHILQSFLSVVESEIQRKRQPTCFRRWEEILDMFDNCFRNPDVEPDEATEDETLIKIRWLLKLHGMDTTDLIRLYRFERMKKTDGQDIGFGSIAVRAIFIGDALDIDIMNARSLKKMDASGSINPYLEVQLLPAHHFPEVAIQKSKVHKNTEFPLFEESFTFSVPKFIQTSEECYLCFTVKDKKLVGSAKLLGESFHFFHQILRSDKAIDMNELDQLFLPLTKPAENDAEYLNVLEGRTWDKMARDFAKNERNACKNY